MKTGTKCLILATCAALVLAPVMPLAADRSDPDDAVPRQSDPTLIPVDQGPLLVGIHAEAMAGAAAAGSKSAADGGLAEARRLEAMKIEAEIATLDAMASFESLDESQREALAHSRSVLAGLLTLRRGPGLEAGGAR